jgi:hypothetical protein
MQTEKYASSICSIINTPGWQDFELYLDERIAALQNRLIDGDIGMEIGMISKENENITIVPIIKDSLQIEIRVLKKLKKKFKDWEQIKKKEVSDGKQI